MTVSHPPQEGPDNFALVIGAMKSGTTSLFEVLAQHPEVAPCRVKEPDFFSEAANFERGWDWYRGLWDWKSDHRVALEASASYTKAPLWPDVPRRIASMPAARFRFIYMIRHPIRRIESQARHSLYEGWGQSLDTGIARDLLEFTRYAMQADQFTEVFPRSALSIVVLEEFERDPRTVLRRLCEFLEIDPDFEFTDPERRYNKGDLYNLPSHWAKVLRGGPLRRVADVVLPRSMRHWIRDLLTGAATTRERSPSGGRHELTPDEVQHVLTTLGPDLRRLRDHYGVDIERHWGPILVEEA
jgi:hypothetical protein